MWPPPYTAGAPPGYMPYVGAPPANGYGAPPAPYGVAPAFGAPSGPSYAGTAPAAPAGYGAHPNLPPALPFGPPPSSVSATPAPGVPAWGQPAPQDPRSGSQTSQHPPQVSIPHPMPPPAGAGAAPTPNRKALLVGCCYRGTSSALKGCTNDVQCMQFALKKVTDALQAQDAVVQSLFCLLHPLLMHNLFQALIVTVT